MSSELLRLVQVSKKLFYAVRNLIDVILDGRETFDQATLLKT